MQTPPPGEHRLGFRVPFDLLILNSLVGVAHGKKSSVLLHLYLIGLAVPRFITTMFVLPIDRKSVGLYGTKIFEDHMAFSGHHRCTRATEHDRDGHPKERPYYDSVFPPNHDGCASSEVG